MIHAFLHILYSTYEYGPRPSDGKPAILRFGAPHLKYRAISHGSRIYARNSHVGMAVSPTDGDEDLIPLGYLVAIPYVYLVPSVKNNIFVAHEQAVALVDGTPMYLTYKREKRKGDIYIIDVDSVVTDEDIENVKSVIIDFYEDFVNYVVDAIKKKKRAIYANAMAAMIARERYNKLNAAIYKKYPLPPVKKGTRVENMRHNAKIEGHLLGGDRGHALIETHETVYYVGPHGIINTDINAKTLREKKYILNFSKDSVLVAFSPRGNDVSIYDAIHGENLLPELEEEEGIRSVSQVVHFGYQDGILTAVFATREGYMYIVRDIENEELIAKAEGIRRYIPISIAIKDGNDIILYYLDDDEVKRIEAEEIEDEFLFLSEDVPSEAMFSYASLYPPIDVETIDTNKRVRAIVSTDGRIYAIPEEGSVLRYTGDDDFTNPKPVTIVGKKGILLPSTSSLSVAVFIEDEDKFLDKMKEFTKKHISVAKS